MLSPSTTIAAAARPIASFSSALEPLADVERPLGAGRGPAATAPPWVRTTRPCRSSDGEVLADGDARDAERRREIRDPGAAVLLDDARDVLLALLGEHVAAARSRSITAPLAAVVR